MTAVLSVLMHDLGALVPPLSLLNNVGELQVVSQRRFYYSRVYPGGRITRSALETISDIWCLQVRLLFPKLLFTCVT